MVSDTGIGIKADELPHVFDRFRQADGSVSREYAGTGNGLALVKEIATLHGGTVAVRSQIFGEGTTFDVTVPLGKAHLSSVSVIEFNEEEAGQVVSPPPSWSRKTRVNQESIEELNRHVEASFDIHRPTILYADDNADLRT